MKGESYIQELKHLTVNEKNALIEMFNAEKVITDCLIRHVLIGSKSRGDYRGTSDVNIMALYYGELCKLDGYYLTAMVRNISVKYGVTISYMLFPVDIEYCDEERADKYGAYRWVPSKIKEDGIFIKKPVKVRDGFWCYADVIDMLHTSDKYMYASRKAWQGGEVYADADAYREFIKVIRDACTKVGSLSVSINPFIVKSTTSDFGLIVYQPTEEDKSALDWVLLK